MHIPRGVRQVMSQSRCMVCRTIAFDLPSMIGAGIEIVDVVEAWIVAASCMACGAISVVTVHAPAHVQDRSTAITKSEVNAVHEALSADVTVRDLIGSSSGVNHDGQS